MGLKQRVRSSGPEPGTPLYGVPGPVPSLGGSAQRCAAGVLAGVTLTAAQALFTVRYSVLLAP